MIEVRWLFYISIHQLLLDLIDLFLNCMHMFSVPKCPACRLAGLKIFASGFRFFAHKFEVFDATGIVVLSWIIDVANE